MRGALVLGLLLAGGAAWAHAFLERALPGAGAEVRKAPDAIVLRFSEPVEPRFSAIAVRDAAGNRVDRGPTAAGETDKTLKVGLGPLPPGVYRVDWRVASVDTHKTEGRYSFTVLP